MSSVFSVLVLIVFFPTALPAHGQALDRAEIRSLYRQGENAFRRANEVLQEDPIQARGLYREAVMSFERMVRDGQIENGKLYYNIGNVYFRLGDLGRAILNYRKAERLTPNDANLQQNLGYARSRRVDKIETKPEVKLLSRIFFWHYDLSFYSRWLFFLVSFNLIWVLAGIQLFWRMAWLKRGILFCALTSLLFAGSLGAQVVQDAHNSLGVILEGEVAARKGDGASYEPSFKDSLHAGTEFRVIQERRGWYQIELADGRHCWIPAAVAGII